ncbi:uncharacterized protein F4812DRAFT_461998 [Daldinia caldariorum]|uniref:uncharacterized protein n=1 Tax=Daldinia caldariorum TaxID=326644 RepID=UPI0020087591|nr:uncharacterized protein F4812DRAFT_461998 [Daldinia caldariorum]KAI1465152.1 hypothetical protein F4812DRAFT_461998 [Daldinia caldariorum]
MEQPEPSTPTDIPTVVPHISADPPTHSSAARSSQNNSNHTSNSVPSLRFPRPLGNRQLTNWISSSSPDIMQPENFPDDDPTLAELGYDVIGTDGESQAESTASSLDYQRTDDVQSLVGTDIGTDVDANEVDTDSSDDEEGEEEATTLNEAPAISTVIDTVVEYAVESDEEDADVETLANQSLEHPTDFSQHGILSLPRRAEIDQSQAREALAEIHKLPSQEMVLGKENGARLFPPEREDPEDYVPEVFRAALRFVQGNYRVLTALSGFVVFYTLVITGKYFLFGPPTPKVLSTVPIASISPTAIPSPFGNPISTSVSTPTLTSTQIQKALQTSTSPSGLVFTTFGKDKDGANRSQQKTICLAELHGRNEIIVKIPQTVKSSWLAKDAILIAVSRGLYDIPTKVTSVDEGFLIQIPLEEACNVLVVSIATTSKPKVKETFHIDFGRNKFTDALGAGKQLVKDFAQKFVDTVNETTAWVEETYMPALDVMSKQVCSQTSSVTDVLLQGFKDIVNAVFGIPSHLVSQVITQIKESFHDDDLARRQHQVQLELMRGARDLRDEVALRYLSAQLRSKLWWLRLRGKTDAYQRYLSKAEAYLKERTVNVKAASRERAEYVRKQIQSRRKNGHGETRGSFWNKRTRGPQA